MRVDQSLVKRLLRSVHTAAEKFENLSNVFRSHYIRRILDTQQSAVILDVGDQFALKRNADVFKFLRFEERFWKSSVLLMD